MDQMESSYSTRIYTDNIFSRSFHLDLDKKVVKNISDSAFRVISTVSIDQIESSNSTRILSYLTRGRKKYF
jgi:hypothetical protein